MNYYEIGQRIRKYRKAQRLSQEKLAELVGISTTHMSHIETGNTKLGLPVLVSLTSALNVGADDLLFESPEFMRTSVNYEIIELLESCSAAQFKVLRDIVEAAKISMDKHM